MHGFVCLALCGVVFGGAGCAATSGPQGGKPDLVTEPAGQPEPSAEPGPASETPPGQPEKQPAKQPEKQPAKQPEKQPEKQPDSAAGPGGRLEGILAAHNRYRQKHCAPPLTWSEELARTARSWADELNKRGCAFEHSPDNRYGENLAYYSPADSATADKVVSGWYDEIARYSFKKPGFSFETGHFTQVVWLGTRELGCAVTTCNNASIWVCNYGPPGNFRRQYKANVLPASCKR